MVALEDGVGSDTEGLLPSDMRMDSNLIDRDTMWNPQTMGKPKVFSRCCCLGDGKHFVGDFMVFSHADCA